jgi:hypothetical protein
MMQRREIKRDSCMAFGTSKAHFRKQKHWADAPESESLLMELHKKRISTIEKELVKT